MKITKLDGIIKHICFCILILGVVLVYKSAEKQKNNYEESIDDSYGIGISDLSKLNCYTPVTISIIDTAINQSELSNEAFRWINKDEVLDNKDSDLNGKISDYFGWNFVKDNNVVTTRESCSHGTMVESLLINILKSTRLEKQCYIKIMNCVVYNQIEDDTDISYIIDAIKYSEKNGASICCLSINIHKYNQELYDAINSSSMLFVVSAGNDGEEYDENTDNYPTSYGLPNVISVAGTLKSGKIDKTSNFGQIVDVAAPGREIEIKLNKFTIVKSGTSFAVPFVCAVAAILQVASRKVLSADYIKERIIYSCKKNIFLEEKISSGGIINLRKSILGLEE